MGVLSYLPLLGALWIFKYLQLDILVPKVALRYFSFLSDCLGFRYFSFLSDILVPPVGYLSDILVPKVR